MKMLYVVIIGFFSFNIFAQNINPNQILKVAIGKNEKVKSVPADVTIKAGKVVDSNCDSLTTSNSDEVKYTLRQVDSGYECVPNKETIERLEVVDIDLGFEITIASIKEQIEITSKEYEKQEKISYSLFGGLAKPNCSLTSGGEVDLSSCTCLENLSFDVTTKSCVQSKNILSFYMYDCSETWRNVIGTMQFFAVNLIPPPEISFGMCSVTPNQYRVLPNLTVYKILYLAFKKESFLKFLNEKESVDSMYLSLTQTELADLSAWLKTFNSSEFDSDFIYKVNNMSDNYLKINLEKLVKVQE